MDRYLSINKFSDVEIICEGGIKLYYNKYNLYYHSEYFKALFSGNFLEKDIYTINLQEHSKESILLYLYYLDNKILSNNVNDVGKYFNDLTNFFKLLDFTNTTVNLNIIEYIYDYLKSDLSEHKISIECLLIIFTLLIKYKDVGHESDKHIDKIITILQSYYHDHANIEKIFNVIDNDNILLFIYGNDGYGFWITYIKWLKYCVKNKKSDLVNKLIIRMFTKEFVENIMKYSFNCRLEYIDEFIKFHEMLPTEQQNNATVINAIKYIMGYNTMN